jgi:hypothetical protein
MTSAEAQTLIDSIDALLAGGIRRVVAPDGRTVEYDLAALRRERARLQTIVAAADVPQVASGFRRVVFRAR